MTTRTGDSIYGFNSNIEMLVRGETLRPFSLEEGGKSFAIWDAGGIDTIDASGMSSSTNQTINLTPGTFSSIGADFVEQANGSIRERPFVNNVTIAFGVAIENAIGGSGADILLGNGARNVLDGRNGDDAIAGFGGDDLLIGGSGQDYLSGGADNDTLDGGASADQLFGEAGSDLLIGGAFGDSLFGGDGFDIASYAGASSRVVFTSTSTAGDIGGDTFNSIEGFELTGFDDILHSFSGAETIWAFGGADEIRSFGGNDIVFAGGGNDSLFGGDGDDNLQGGEGNDQLEGGNGADQIDGGIGADTMTGGAGNDIYFVNDALDSIVELTNIRTPSGAILSLGVDLVVSTLDFTLTTALENLTLWGFGLLRGTGSSLANTITGNPSDNVLDGRGGADTLRGQRGNDTYIVDNALDVVDETGGGSADIDTVESSVTFSLATTLGNVENLTLTGAAAINATGNALDNVLRGNSAINTLTGSGGNDRLFGFAGDDSLSGGAGNDTMTGGAGNDKLSGSTGNDSYDFRTFLVAGVALGADTIVDSGGADTLIIDSSTQIRSASRSGDDVIVTLAQGTVRITGQFTGSGIEQVQTGNGSFVMATSLLGGDASGIITGTRRSDLMDGRGGDDILFGSAGNDTLLGSEGADRLDGGAGRDTLDGGVGDDLLTGGAGRDTFVFAPGYGADTVADFDRRFDSLDMSAFGFAPSETRIDATIVLYFGGGDVLTLNLKRPLPDGYLDSLA
jgi:Ca2+-binding RTX toxin-like protein